MEPKAALELLVAGLNRGAFNPLEQAGLNSAVAVLVKAIEPPVTPKEDEAPPNP
jgi:hypothetical protein